MISFWPVQPASAISSQNRLCFFSKCHTVLFLQDDYHVFPTMDGIILELNGSTFQKLTLTRVLSRSGNM